MSTTSDMSKHKKLELEKVRQIVGSVPGARLFQPGDKIDGQEEREEIEAEWMRGEFDPCGDGVVTGLRVERGEGRSAEMATGPQPKQLDDLVITLRGSPTKEGAASFYSSKAKELDLLHRKESTWALQLSDERLMEHWANAFRAMSRGDWCRFTCAAKKAQPWLQVSRSVQTRGGSLQASRLIAMLSRSQNLVDCLRRIRSRSDELQVAAHPVRAHAPSQCTRP